MKIKEMLFYLSSLLAIMKLLIKQYRGKQKIIAKGEEAIKKFNDLREKETKDVLESELMPMFYGYDIQEKTGYLSHGQSIYTLENSIK